MESNKAFSKIKLFDTKSIATVNNAISGDAKLLDYANSSEEGTTLPRWRKIKRKEVKCAEYVIFCTKEQVRLVKNYANDGRSIMTWKGEQAYDAGLIPVDYATVPIRDTDLLCVLDTEKMEWSMCKF